MAIRGLCRLVRSASESKEAIAPSNEVRLRGTDFSASVVLDEADKSRVVLTRGENPAFKVRFKDESSAFRCKSFKIPESSLSGDKWETREAWNTAVFSTLVKARKSWNELDKSGSARYEAELLGV